MLLRRPGRRVAVLLLAVVITLIGCQFADKEPYLYFKDDAGNTLMTDKDLESLKVISMLNGGGRGLYIVPKDKNKVEEITTKALGNSIEIYYENAIAHSSKVTKAISGINLVLNDMDEETLKRLEQVIQDNG